MYDKKLKAAISEAERFLERAKELSKTSVSSNGYFYGSKLTGAVKRSSMDLTRALADLRKSN